jgi:fido (protein-threonine AMPylation protein)
MGGKLREVDVQDRLIGHGVPAWEIERTLDRIFDKLSTENHLKVCDFDEWAGRSSYYLGELLQIQPFLAGNAIALQEFTKDLARENDIRLQWMGLRKSKSMMN